MVEPVFNLRNGGGNTVNQALQSSVGGVGVSYTTPNQGYTMNVVRNEPFAPRANQSTSVGI